MNLEGEWQMCQDCKNEFGFDDTIIPRAKCPKCNSRNWYFVSKYPVISDKHILPIIVKGNPISDNHIYGHKAFGKRVIKYMTAKGKLYKQQAALVAKDCQPTSKPIIMKIKVFFGDKRKRDIQGHLKAIIDSFEGLLYHNDNQVQILCAEKYYDKENPRVEIIIDELLEV